MEKNCTTKMGEEWNVDLDVCDKMVTFKIDTGAQVNVLPKNQYDRLLWRPKLLKSSVKS